MYESEAELEKKLLEWLVTLKYETVRIRDEQDLIANLKTQLEKHNKVQLGGTPLTDKEFTQVLHHLNKGNVWDRAKSLRDKMTIRRDKARLVSSETRLASDAGNSQETIYLEFINQEFWCQNQYQVTHQITNEGSYKNRYDVTILINGLPLVQIELKRRGLALKEAFNQINRYQRHSYSSHFGLFQYIQIFVISNGVDTKYYSNNKSQNFKQTFYWSDKENKPTKQLEAFTQTFLEPCHLSKMITKYIVLSEKDKTLMVLRPYQYFAVEAILERVKTNPTRNGYIWHTTGSGKTLTSFKASQILVTLPEVHKVVFVVDRKDLDYQTTKEFNSFSDGSVDGTDNTKKLVGQFEDDTKLIVTTIQKLNTAISKTQHLAKMERLKDKRIIFIFDECHRTQFGETHARIKKFFTKNQLFGFTGTPILVENALSVDGKKRTTKELFDDRLHEYVITNAIKDDNVLRFSVEYVGKYKQKPVETRHALSNEINHTLSLQSPNEIDIEVEGTRGELVESIDTQELFTSDNRIDKISDYIIQHHNQKTHNKTFTGMFCVGSVDVLTKYYDAFAKKKAEGKHNLRIATIFSYQANTDENSVFDIEEMDFVDFDKVAEPQAVYKAQTHREKLDKYIEDYNKMFGTKYSTKDSQAFYNYYNEISKRVRDKEIDILLVVNMFLTGFDSKTLNTLYVDKNLRYHGLIQAFSRTNRTLDERKSHGNIVCFRNLKEATDEAIRLFSDKDAKEEIILKPYPDYVKRFNQAYKELVKIVPTIDSVDDLPSEVEQLEFIEKFRALMRLKNTLTTFVDFNDDDLDMTAQDFEDYKSKYLDLYDSVKTNTEKEKTSILDDVDFELELIHRDEINVAYILALLAKYKNASQAEQAKKYKEILDLLEGQISLRSKRILIEKFIAENLPHIEETDQIESEFELFWNNERARAIQELCEAEKINQAKFKDAISEYLFSQRLPLPNEFIDMLDVKPNLLGIKPARERLKNKIIEFVETFIENV